MITQVSALQIFILIGAAQGFILAAHIFLYQRRESANIFLATGLFVLSIRLLIYPFREISIEPGWTFIQNLSLISLLLVGPALFLFIRGKLGTNAIRPSVSWLHFVPFLVYLTHIIYPHFQLPVCYSYATLYSGIFYGFIGMWTINGTHFASLFRQRNYQLNSFAFPLLIIPTSIYGLSYLEERLLDLHPATFPYLVLTFLFYRMSFKSLQGSKKFLGDLLSQSEAKLSIDPDHLAQLMAVVERDQVYLDNKLSVVELANRTGFSRHEISQLINVGLGTNFHDFINSYRIKVIKERLADPTSRHLSIAGIAQESGFRSKSTFHQVFKEMTGVTPGEYQKSVSKKKSEMA
ncbi:MAG: helix-turn-helix domain-containing protein [Cyclobacteriaceae bacterium]